MVQCYLITEQGRRAVPSGEGSLEEIALSQGINPDSHIFLRGRVPVPMTTVPVAGDEIRVISVASGG